MAAAGTAVGGRSRLVAAAADALRSQVFAAEPGAFIGSLNDVASALQVGIVTVQQAARILEHEGVLDVRRGPHGGYYGRRPDARTLERVLLSYMRSHPDVFDEALNITSLLFIELCAAAASCTDRDLRAELAALSARYAAEKARDDLGSLETSLQELLFRMVDRPIFETLTRVTLFLGQASDRPHVQRDAEELTRWVAGRRRIIAAIESGDAALARFEADRSNRQPLLARLRERSLGRSAGP